MYGVKSNVSSGPVILLAVLIALARPAAGGEEVMILDAQQLASSALLGVAIKDSELVIDAGSCKETLENSGPAKGIRHFRGTVTSSEITPADRFDQMIVSWNSSCPPGTWLVIEARARRGAKWTRWYNLGHWALDSGTIKRTSVKGQKTEDGRVDTDTLVLSRPCEAAQVRVSLRSLAGASVSPRLRRVVLAFASSLKEPIDGQDRSIWGTVLDVPQISQLSYPPRGGVWCSPTSVTMVMNYWAKKRGRDEWATDVRTAAAAIHDQAWGGTGNWTFNAAFAGARKGLVAYCTRFSGFGEVEDWVRRGVPVVLSISANILRDRGPSGGGHLIVCVGFDKEGNPVCNDPYAKLDSGESVRRTYPRDKLLKAWLNKQSLGAVYLIYPEDLDASARK